MFCRSRLNNVIIVLKTRRLKVGEKERFITLWKPLIIFRWHILKLTFSFYFWFQKYFQRLRSQFFVLREKLNGNIGYVFSQTFLESNFLTGNLRTHIFSLWHDWQFMLYFLWKKVSWIFCWYKNVFFCGRLKKNWMYAWKIYIALFQKCVSVNKFYKFLASIETSTNSLTLLPANKNLTSSYENM